MYRTVFLLEEQRDCVRVPWGQVRVAFLHVQLGPVDFIGRQRIYGECIRSCGAGTVRKKFDDDSKFVNSVPMRMNGPYLQWSSSRTRCLLPMYET
jgi:hypothetical protein